MVAIHHDPAVRRMLFFTGLVVLAEPLATTMLLSFVVFMVRDFENVDERSVAFWCGMITSAFFIAQVFTAPLFGLASDRIGRKPVLLFGLFGSAVCTILFGVSDNLTMAIVSRALCGLFNGNAGVSRTSVGELAVNNGIHQGRAFSIFGLCTAMGTLLGPLLGGFLCQPAEKYGLKGPGELFVRYPYLLPCAIGACYNVAVVALCAPYMGETNVDNTTSTGTKLLPADECEDNNTARGSDERMDEDTPLILSQNDTASSKAVSNRTRSLVLLIAGHAAIALHAIAFDEMYPAIAATSPPIGLGFSSNEIAKTLLFLSPVVFTVQFVGYPVLSKRLTYANLWRISSVFFLVVYMAFPFLMELPNKSYLQWSCLYLLLAMRISAVVIGYTSVAILLTLSARPNQRGVTVSFAQAAISASRAIGPAFAGALWSWGLWNGFKAPFDQNTLFAFQCLAATLQLMTSFGPSIGCSREGPA